jgi:hypothetical protein
MSERRLEEVLLFAIGNPYAVYLNVSIALVGQNGVAHVSAMPIPFQQENIPLVLPL